MLYYLASLLAVIVGQFFGLRMYILPMMDSSYPEYRALISFFSLVSTTIVTGIVAYHLRIVSLGSKATRFHLIPFIIALLLSPTPAFAAEGSTYVGVLEKAMAMVGVLAEKTGQVAQAAWPDVVRYHVAFQIGTQIALFLGFLLCLTLLIFIIKASDKPNAGVAALAFLGAVSFVGVLGTAIFSIIASVYAVAAIYAPQTFTALELLKAVRK